MIKIVAEGGGVSTVTPLSYRVTLRQVGFPRFIVRQPVAPPRTALVVSRGFLMARSQLPRGDIRGQMLRYTVVVEAIYPNGVSSLARTLFKIKAR